MKHIIIFLLTFAVASGCGVALAHPAGNLPSPGLIPSNAFYFLDRLGEALQEFFTFSPEAKIKLETEFAKERIAEIQITLETQGVDDPGLDIALERLINHFSKASDIIREEKDKGQDVDQFAEDLNNNFDEDKDLLQEAFRDKKAELENKEKELEDKIEEAENNNDNNAVEALTKELDEVKMEEEKLDMEIGDFDEELNVEEGDLDEELNVSSEDENDLDNLQSEFGEIENLEKETLKEVNKVE